MPDELPEKEILTAEEVAEYLRVSERTVYDWAQKGEIPAGKLGNTWRFRRSRIEKWVDDNLSQGETREETERENGRIADCLVPERIVFLEENDKETVLQELCARLAKTPEVRDEEKLTQAIFDRERLMSTGIGFGVAVPHVRIASVTDLVMAVGVCSTPLEDYESLDDEPIRIVCMVAASEGQHSEYLQTLSAISKRLKDPRRRQRLLSAADGQEAWRILTGQTGAGDNHE